MWLWDSLAGSWIRWRTRRLPVTALDRVGDGARVKIAGRLEAGEQPLQAPVSGRACAAWSVEVQEAPLWETVVVEHRTRDFVLRDGSGRPALVRASRARVVFETDASSWPARPSERMLALLRRHRLREDGFDGSLRPYRYCEGVLEAGELITVVGVARLELDPSGTAGSYREPPLRVVLDATPRAPLWIIDGPARWRLE